MFRALGKALAVPWGKHMCLKGGKQICDWEDGVLQNNFNTHLRIRMRTKKIPWSQRTVTTEILQSPGKLWAWNTQGTTFENQQILPRPPPRSCRGVWGRPLCWSPNEKTIPSSSYRVNAAATQYGDHYTGPRSRKGSSYTQCIVVVCNVLDNVSFILKLWSWGKVCLTS